MRGRMAAYLCLLGGVVANLVRGRKTAGLVNTWGTMTVYVTSYLHLYNESTNLSTMFCVFPLTVVFYSIGSVLGTALYRRFGARATVALGGAVVSGVLFSLSFTISTPIFIACYSAAVGYAGGSMVMTPAWPAAQYFPTRKGTVTGVVMLGYGFGNLLDGLLFTFLANPDNLPPDVEVHHDGTTDHLFSAEVALRVPASLRYLSAALFIFALLGCTLISDPATNSDLRLSAHSSILQNERKSNDSEPNFKREFPSKCVAAKSWPFWDMCLIAFFGCSFGLYITNQYKNYGMTHIKNDHLLSYIGTIAAFCNAFARFFLTFVLDFMSFRLLYSLNSIVQAILAATISLVADSSVLFGIWVSLSFVCHAANLSPFAVESGTIFGPE